MNTMPPVGAAGGKAGGDFACEICEFRARTTGRLVNHMQTVHDPSRPEVCEQCGYRFVLNVHLLEHIRRMHDRELNYKCLHVPGCGKEYFSKGELNRHIIMTHKMCLDLSCKFSNFPTPQEAMAHCRSVHDYGSKRNRVCSLREPKKRKTKNNKNNGANSNSTYSTPVASTASLAAAAAVASTTASANAAMAAAAAACAAGVTVSGTGEFTIGGATIRPSVNNIPASLITSRIIANAALTNKEPPHHHQAYMEVGNINEQNILSYIPSSHRERLLRKPFPVPK